MSSSVIRKADYIKAAGIVAGIISATGDRVYIYDAQTGERATAETLRDRFAELHELNALSVQRQYHDAAPEIDPEPCTAELSEGIALGRRAVFAGRATLARVIYELRHFFRSCCYQVEDWSANLRMESYLDRITVSLMGLLDPEPDEHQSWGEIDIAI